MKFIDRLNRLSKVQTRFPQRAASLAVNFSKERFRRKNWVDRSPHPWKERKEKDTGSLMIKSGRLKRSIRKIHVSEHRVIIGTDVPYARIHNDGLKIEKTVNIREHKRKITRGRKPRTVKVKAHTRKMNIKYPERKFLGESAILLRRLERLLERDIKNATK